MNKEDLQKYCDRPDRENIATPFSIGDFTYATNGHVIVRVPRLSDVPERGNAPKAEELFSKMEIGEYFPIPYVPAEKKENCPECEGLGYYTECPECEGSGDVEFSTDYHDYTETCETCGGSGKFTKENPLECEKCGGEGKVVKREIMEASRNMYDTKYLRWLKELPNCMLSTAEYLSPTHFKFDGGDGLIMQMKV